MSFLHPEFLYLMLPPVLLLFYFFLTQDEPSAQLFDSRVFARLRVNEKRLSLRHRNIIYLLIFILLIIAMAQPVIHEATIKVRSADRTLTVAIDISASMQTEDLYPSRLAVAREKLLHLIDTTTFERIGILAFGKDVYVLAPPSSDRRILRQMVERFDPEAHAEAGTDLTGLLAAANEVMQKGENRNLLLMTDGGDRRDLGDAAASAKANGIRLFILGTGTSQGAPLLKEGVPILQKGEPVVTTLNPALAELAAATEGLFVPAEAGASDLSFLLGGIRMHYTNADEGVKKIRQYGQLYILPLGLALFLLLVATSSMSRRETVAVPPVLLGMLFLGNAVSLKAETFDYELLQKARQLYEKREYTRAANTYYRYAKRNGDDAQAIYDSAHAFYREGRYDAAAALWGGIHTKDRLLQYAALHNLGNAHAMLGGEEHFTAAIKAYSKALYLQNDPETRENLETVRGWLMRLMQAKLRKETPKMARSAQRKESEGAGSQSAPESRPSFAREGDGHEEESRPSETSAREAAASMSDFEAGMWVKSLRRQTQTHLYKITPKTAEAGRNVAPW